MGGGRDDGSTCAPSSEPARVCGMEVMGEPSIRVTIHQPEHLPWLGFFAKAASCDLLILLDTVPYRHGYFQNRNRLSRQGEAIWLTVPVRHRGLFGTEIRHIRINETRPWRRQYLGRLEDALRRTPDAQAVLVPLRRIIEEAPAELSELNTRIIRWLSDVLGVATPMRLASEFQVAGRSSELLARLCEVVGADVYLSGPSGRDYLDLRPFQRVGITVEYFRFQHPEYPRGDEPWIPNLSAVDLVAQVGVERARRLLADAASASRREPALV
jgi:WbqC-like protein family